MLLEQLRHRISATLIGLLEAQPIAANVSNGRSACIEVLLLNFQKFCVALDFLVVMHAVEGIFTFKLRPFASLAKQLQPIVAHSVFLVSTCIALKETFDFIVRRVAQTNA